MKRILMIPFAMLVFACGEPSEVSPDVALPPVADPATDPVALFEAVTEAVLAVDAVQYSFTVEGISVMEDTVRFESEGEAVLQKATGLEDASIYVNFTVRVLSDSITEEGTIVSDGVTAAHLNRSENKYMFGLVEDGGASIVLANNVPLGSVLREFLFTSEPYGAELNAAGYEMQEQQEIYGTLCHVVTVDIPPYRSTWWISTETMLPVCNFISIWNPDGTGMEYLVTLSDVDTDIQPDPSMFQLPCPPGIEARQVLGSISEGSQAPLWSLHTPDGQILSLADLRGKVVVMDFWATWCGPCREVMPVLQELHETYGDDLAVIGINVWEQGDPVAFMAENGYTYTIVLGGDEVAAEYIVEGIPTFYVIDPQGNVAFHAVGADPANEEALRQSVGTLLQ